MDQKLTKKDSKRANYSLLDNPEAIRLLPVRAILEMNKNIDFSDLTPTIKNVALESFKIESQYKKFKINYHTIKAKLVEFDPWLTPSEFDEIERENLSLDQSIIDLTSNLDNVDGFVEQIRLREIEKLVEYKSDILVDESFTKSNRLASKYLKKIIIDHINLEMFGKKEKYKGKIVEKMKETNEKGQHLFLYFNSNPMETIKTTKTTHIMDGDGSKLKIKEVFQSNEIFSKVILINSKQVRIRVPIYFGMIVCGESV